MNRLLTILCVLGLGLGATATAQAASNTMSFGFYQEMAGITPQGEIRADIYDNTSLPADIRIGVFGGEVMIDASTTAATATGIGYKHPLNRKMAVYGSLYFISGGNTNITGGFSYSTVSNGMVLNGNANFFSAGGSTTLNANGAVFYPLSQNAVSGKVYLGGELTLELSPTNTTALYAGLRWMPKRNLVVDTGFVSSTGGTTTIGTPVFLRLNIGL